MSTMNSDNCTKLNSNSINYAKNMMDRTFHHILEKKGYKLTGTIGNGSYAKVK
jgi:hypothetical protein